MIYYCFHIKTAIVTMAGKKDSRCTFTREQARFFDLHLARFEGGRLAALVKDRSCGVNMHKMRLWTSFTQDFNQVGGVFLVRKSWCVNFSALYVARLTLIVGWKFGLRKKKIMFHSTDLRLNVPCNIRIVPSKWPASRWIPKKSLPLLLFTYCSYRYRVPVPIPCVAIDFT